MPDYLGKDQRKTREGGDDEEKPITSEGKRSFKFYVIIISGLDEGDIQILKTYVSILN